MVINPSQLVFLLITLVLAALLIVLPRLITRIRLGPGLHIDDLVKQLAQGDTLILDVRTSKDFVGEQGHIDHAVNLPLEILQQRIHELLEHQQRPIAIICRTDKRSAKAARILSQQGFNHVHVVRGGMTQWLKDERPVVR